MKPCSVLVEYNEQGKEMFIHPSSPLLYLDAVEKLQEMIK